MAFAFTDPDRPAAKAIRSLARKRIAASQKLIQARSLPSGELVRELRKNIKKTRALLRLVRPHFKSYRRENDALRDAARLLAPLRDAHALSDTFDQVSQRVVLPPDTLFALRNSIITLPDDHEKTDVDALFAAHASSISEVANRIASWKIIGSGFDALKEGLEKTWTDAQKAMRHAIADPSGENLHIWRKRVKDHWYHARLLAPIWPEMMHHHIAAADILGETLGEARDLAFLMSALGKRPEAKKICALATDDEARLLADAHRIGFRFFAEPGSGLSQRWQGWWDLWRSPAKLPVHRPAPVRSTLPSPRPRKAQ